MVAIEPAGNLPDLADQQAGLALLTMRTAADVNVTAIRPVSLAAM
jgi:hypothetical protein